MLSVVVLFLFSLFYVLSLQGSIVLGPRIVVFEALNLLSCCYIVVVFIVFMALIALEYCVGSSDCGV